MLRQNVIPFWKELFVPFKMAPHIEKHSLYFSSCRPLYKAHRLGNRVIPNKLRPIIAKFHYYNDREQVRTAAFRLKDDLKRENFGVGIQLPKEWREARKQLYPAMQAERIRVTTPNSSAKSCTSTDNHTQYVN